MKQHRPSHKRHTLKPADVRDLCHEAMPVGDGETPLRATGWTDTRGRWTRVQVEYPNGWALSVRFRRDGTVDCDARKLVATISGAVAETE